MPGGRQSDDSERVPSKLSLSQRLLVALPRFGRNDGKAPLGSRLKEAMAKPVEPDAAKRAKAADQPMTVPELEEAVTSANDKERLTGLLLAPVGAAIAIIVTQTLVSRDPAPRLKNGSLNKLYVNPSIYHELELVLIVLAFIMLVTAFYRKRLFLGITMALYGLAVFNLHYWGFGIPYILAGAWLLVTSYRLQRDLKEATGQGPSRSGVQRRPSGSRQTTPNKRYTPPKPASKPAPKKAPRAKRGDEKQAG